MTPFPKLCAILFLAILSVTGVTNYHSSASNSVSTSEQQVGFGLDCHGDSPISETPFPMSCPDPFGINGWKPTDDGKYVGQDEPTVQFISSTKGSANNFEWAVTLPTDPVPTQSGSSVASFELYDAFWFSLTLCDSYSYPQNPCKPDSDANIGGKYPSMPNANGSAALELQFYPPPSPYCVQSKHWCASVVIFSFESTYNQAYVNPDCTEPFNLAHIQMNGKPTGPVAPGKQTIKSYETNAETLLMSGGNKLLVKINDTSAGMYTGVTDLTTGKTGYMVASSANGFAHTNYKTCVTTHYSFHPEFNSAISSHTSPWTEDSFNVDYAYELGHFELGQTGDSDSDDSSCYSISSPIAGCVISQDSDFDSLSYSTDWANGSSSLPSPLVIGSPNGEGIGPMSYVSGGFTSPYQKMLFTTIVAAEEPLCSATSPTKCKVPPPLAAFYPYYNGLGTGTTCVLTFGQTIPGQTTNNFGKDLEYGKPQKNAPWDFQSPIFTNPCLP